MSQPLPAAGGSQLALALIWGPVAASLPSLPLFSCGLLPSVSVLCVLSSYGDTSPIGSEAHLSLVRPHLNSGHLQSSYFYMRLWSEVLGRHEFCRDTTQPSRGGKNLKKLTLPTRTLSECHAQPPASCYQMEREMSH